MTAYMLEEITPGAPTRRVMENVSMDEAVTEFCRRRKDWANVARFRGYKLESTANAFEVTKSGNTIRCYFVRPQAPKGK